MRDDSQADEPGLASALASLREILIPQETLEAWAVQRRMFALAHRRMLVAATSGRLIWIDRKLLGGFDLHNVRWQDLEDVALKVGIFGADLIVRAGRAADLASEGAVSTQTHHFAGLRKVQAQAVYRICQAQDQAWREKRRVRELEELRARSGGFQLANPLPPLAPSAPSTNATDRSAPSGSPAGGPDAARRLSEAKKLLEERLITDSEYEAIKARILSSG